MTDAQNKSKRIAIKGQLTRFIQYFDSIKLLEPSCVDVQQLQSRLDNTLGLLDDFDTVQLAIESKDKDYDLNISIHEQERLDFENSFYSVTSNAKRFISNMTPNQAPLNISVNQNANPSVTDYSNIKLPSLNLPSFDGSYENWLFFRDTFNSVIHNNVALSNVQKFHYLRLSLKSDAAETIKSLEISDANYNLAWTLLQERYENKQILVNNHIKALFNLNIVNKETHQGLRFLLDGMQKHMRALEVLGLPVEHWDALVIHLISSKLDVVTKRDWEQKNNSSDRAGRLPTYIELTDFLKEKCRLLESLELSDEKHRLSSKSNNFEKVVKSHNKSFVTKTKLRCSFCNKDHTIYFCPDFGKLDPTKRYEESKRLKLCINCLRAGHFTKECRSSACRKCGKNHHTLLHIENTSGLQTDKNKETRGISSTDNSSNSNSFTSQSPIALSTNITKKSYILLSTALVTIFDKFGNPHDCRALLDCGSQSNFISENLCRKLNLQKTKVDFSVFGIGETNSLVKYRTFAKIQSKINTFHKTISCLILDSITGEIPSFDFDKTQLSIPDNITLADPTFNQASSIDLLIGSEHFWDLLMVGQVKLNNGNPILQKSKFGWLISGPMSIPNMKNETSILSNLSATLSLENQIEKFWKLEECPKRKFLSPEESFCEEYFKNTTTFTNGRFTVKIPLKSDPSHLGDSKHNATKRFYSLERKLASNYVLKQQYDDFINEYISLNHMSLSKRQNDDSGFFLPHHCVIKDTSTTTRLRVVFDGSSKTSSGLSVNDIMFVGPTVQDDLLSIILRFRTHPVVLSGDIEKCYRMVLMHPEHRALQKILWRFSPNDPLSVYELNTVTYGLASSAYLATRTLQEVGHMHKDTSPMISNVILRDFYVDDLLTGGDSIEHVKQIKHELSELLQSHGFSLRKWTSNVTELSDSDRAVNFDDNQPSKTLGLLWNPSSDFLSYNIGLNNMNKQVSKRHILSCIAQIFDPLGLLSPVTVTAKIILQQLWSLKISWDESIPIDLYTIWTNYRQNLLDLNAIKFPRYIFCKNPSSIQLHGFSDASQSAYGACVYVRTVDKLGHCYVHLLCSKTRVAPLKYTTIPRLELSAALLLAELIEKVRSSLTKNFDQIYYWCDSTIVLAWIKTPPNLLKQFVANRVDQIQTLTKSELWNYINTSQNPADMLSRGLNPSNLLNCETWFHGPSWLCENEQNWPNIGSTIANDQIPEMKIKPVSLIILENGLLNVVTRFSSLVRLQRIFAYMIRFKSNCMPKNKQQRICGSLTCSELNNSMNSLVKIVQKATFPEEYNDLIKGKNISSKSKLLSLNPFMDENQIIRVGGRIGYSHFGYIKKHPVVLPAKHHFSDLVARHEHITQLHAGPEATLASLRERFWPLAGRNLVRKIVHNCVTCFKVSPSLQQHIMGNLPKDRLSPSRAFLVTGLDYAGPFMLKDRKTRGSKITKAYIALFVCFCTKAMHIEIVSDLTTQCFIAALRRFMSRRGKCAQIYCDNASTFVGAANELKQFVKNSNNTIIEELSKDKIEFSFIPPRAPHFGGLWESGVKSVKSRLKRVIGNASLTFEEFSTVLCQIEACLNSRPLYPISSDPNDFLPLTPAHFLIGESMTSIPSTQLIYVKENLLTRYQRLQQLVQHFWSRWSKEYVSNLQIRTKWKQNHQEIVKPGLLVLVKEDNLPPLKWCLGRIVELHSGADNVTRAVSVKTCSGVIKRPVIKICVLPGQD